jgi:hypothetical protein
MIGKKGRKIRRLERPHDETMQLLGGRADADVDGASDRVAIPGGACTPTRQRTMTIEDAALAFIKYDFAFSRHAMPEFFNQPTLIRTKRAQGRPGVD